MLTVSFINTPTKGTVRILLRRIFDDAVKEKLNNGLITAIGFIQGPIATVLAAGDIAEKTSDVEIAEIVGNCPQHITMVGVFGDTSSVSEALKAVEAWGKETGNG
ncbi:MAG: BMC domain-containing protein [Christensenellales bacterium]|jgi:ethanolamine utilization microcompartment shell protein EutS